MREFVVEAWPILIAGSAVLAILNYFELADFFNYAGQTDHVVDGPACRSGCSAYLWYSPQGTFAGDVGQALGTSNFASAMTSDADARLCDLCDVLFTLSCHPGCLAARTWHTRHADNFRIDSDDRLACGFAVRGVAIMFSMNKIRRLEFAELSRTFYCQPYFKISVAAAAISAAPLIKACSSKSNLG